MIGLFRFLFWFFLISYILRILGRYIFPILLKRYIKKKQSQFNQQFNQQDSTLEKEGEVSIKTKPKKSKTDTDDMGEYVDFEEVDD
ncbi:MAG: DUF4834 family protein [Flavobacteriales bacterium]|jgi:hypothetical protein|nr:DUF4834 family protein [Flavobacteriales bacterium]MBT4737743.1 DUF4834 family protein [Flavobacteriales bacterium]MBT5354182.1 DUF4834 family protein [Flavobacteriales bacterium]MBT5698991.1 DUF4834 family protein [Flavobacteriales bacterium]MBT6699911.1 DUF4834 family protein [Flavobacteriales bacterium]